MSEALLIKQVPPAKNFKW